MVPATHFRAPECEKQKGQTNRPPEQETKDSRDHQARVNVRLRATGLVNGTAPLMDICGIGHFPLHDGNTPL
jgi:hypothetical protein